MKIKILENCMYTANMKAGEVLDLPVAWADSLIRGNHAEMAPTEKVTGPEFKTTNFESESQSKAETPSHKSSGR